MSFVKTPDVLKHLRSYIESRARDRKINIIAKIESRDSLKNLEDIITVSDGAMVARGDLGAQVPLEQVRRCLPEVFTVAFVLLETYATPSYPVVFFALFVSCNCFVLLINEASGWFAGSKKDVAGFDFR